MKKCRTPEPGGHACTAERARPESAPRRTTKEMTCRWVRQGLIISSVPFLTGISAAQCAAQWPAWPHLWQVSAGRWLGPPAPNAVGLPCRRHTRSVTNSPSPDSSLCSALCSLSLSLLVSASPAPPSLVPYLSCLPCQHGAIQQQRRRRQWRRQWQHAYMHTSSTCAAGAK